MAIKNSFIFGGVSSADYGIFIGGEGVFDAPKRAVEMLEVPGRNGAIAIDLGRYENITVEYPVFVPARSKKEFRSKLSKFVNAIASQKGYQRLSDTYHPGEYRMGLFAEQIEVDPVRYNTAGGFRLIFNCKPQRYLISGEQEVSVSSGDTLINPTLFDSQPLLAVEGYGEIKFNDYEIDLSEGYLGQLYAVDRNGYQIRDYTFSHGVDAFMTELIYNDGDMITVSAIHAIISEKINPTSTPTNFRVTPSDGVTILASSLTQNGNFWDLRVEAIFPETQLQAIDDTEDRMGSCTIHYEISGSVYDYQVAPYLWYNELYDQKRLVIGLYKGFKWDCVGLNVSVDSTVSMLGHPTYIDCDFGECYRIDDGIITSLNKYIDLGSDLPSFKPGTNEITHDNTITEVIVKPRWWKI